MMLLAEATPKIWSSGHTLELGLQRSGSTQVQGLQNCPPSHQCNPTNSQFGKRERDLTYPYMTFARESHVIFPLILNIDNPVSRMKI